ncbi:hypothetical protein [Nitrosopumilus sp.]|uniref:hypothetical protein n=1 Tax=Nitrosopumilus sp. TaxID=2024843 RepID=UPI00261A5B65|nr:hypothetical protein [Nitrosopumilus sp.]
MTKMIQVNLDVQNVDQNEAQEWANEIVNVYADMEVANVNVSGNKIAFQAGFSGMDDTTSDDIQQKIEEYATMTEIFQINKISCS